MKFRVTRWDPTPTPNDPQHVTPHLLIETPSLEEARTFRRLFIETAARPNDEPVLTIEDERGNDIPPVAPPLPEPLAVTPKGIPPGLDIEL